MSLFIINKTIALKKALIVPGVLSTAMVGTETIDMQTRTPVSAQTEVAAELQPVLTTRGYRWASSESPDTAYILTAQTDSGHEGLMRRGQREMGPSGPTEALDWGLAGTQRQLSRQE